MQLAIAICRERNKVISIGKKEFDLLNHPELYSLNSEFMALIDYLKVKGFCCGTTLNEIEHPLTDSVDIFLSEKVSDLVLQVTQNCNLRCSYCAYSGNYHNRKHNSKRMNFETAKRAVDFFINHSSDCAEVGIGFYGGEPLLEIELIQRVIEYIEENYFWKKIRYNLTTNLTLMSEQILDYASEKDINIMISIDGPKDVQDKYRLFSNGKGSYSKVTERAKIMKNRNPEFFSKCTTNTVVSPEEDFEHIVSFLNTSELFGALDSMVTQLSDVGTKISIDYDNDYYIIARREHFKLLLSMVEEIDDSHIPRLYLNNKISILEMYQKLKGNGIRGLHKSHPGGPCIPGCKKLFVDVKGNFYPCEKIPEEEQFQIGNLENGFDSNKIKKILNIGRLTNDECLNCWGFIYCSSCAVSTIDKTSFSRNKRLSKCQTILDDIQNLMSDVEILKNYRFDFESEM